MVQTVRRARKHCTRPGLHVVADAVDPVAEGIAPHTEPTMAFFDWDPRYDIGVEAMNREHRTLLDLMSKLHAACQAGASRASIIASLDLLGRFTVQHFKDEEAYMEQIQYADRRGHAGIHKNLLAKFEEHRNKFVHGKDAVLPAAFFDFLKLWLQSHILGVDMRYGGKAAARKSA